ncbi:CRISPR-associated helicase/endonuclease Cas3 [Sporanaerobium hydrogeniformans]|uniref:CRISPR-associated helicase/endonuclease Cas3 n=1 Tax=Sporanaerobium hydrogeniformans TaxID=3072179 RepID=A0AC61DF69_9FIRM|nr:CRISPR-associated helicase/endonuclease Cas3 [Sporanaerobium hydrogeniformans]PHV71525.1 CRISPR-associated helicase/endonuclease Cas3 [Sporanaerobium hydrogeniformans]
MEYYGRSVQQKEEIVYQFLKDHLKNVARLCEGFVEPISAPQIGTILGYLHDVGKYSDDFQRRIRGEKIRVSHADAGARILEEYYMHTKNPLYRLLTYVVYGHHSGLHDYGTPAKGMCKQLKIPSTNVSAWKEEIGVLPAISPQDLKLQLRGKEEFVGFTLQFYTRFLLSCLVDADRIDAQDFPNLEATKAMAVNTSMETLKERYEQHMTRLAANARESHLNQIRKGILKNCLDKGRQKKGMYSLTVPTGGGKTLSSLGFALTHAVANKQKRIIYAIPFTSIIEQNASVFADVLGKEHILEHHSNYENPYNKQEELVKFQLAQENWHEPIVVTTNVQFFETLFSHKATKVRKLHNIAQSIIILDEIQSLPNKYIKPCLMALNELVVNYGCTVVLCSATQPEYHKNKLFLEEVNVEEMIENPSKLFEELKRTEEHYLGEQTIEEIACKIRADRQALCIVNTKKHAREIFERLEGEENCFHLSTNMYPKHRKTILSSIRQLLKDDKPCKVIATQLIEAGVDIDFPIVYRSITGIDSIVQAAGRCNREGKLAKGLVYVFKPEEEYIGKEYLALTAGIGEMILNKEEAFLDLPSISKYFTYLFDITHQNLDYYHILQLCTDGIQNPYDIRFNFEEISTNFKFIDNQGYSLIIPNEESVNELLEQVRFTHSVQAIVRKLASYTISVKRYELDGLKEEGALRIVEETLMVLDDLKFYNEDIGLVIKKEQDDFDYVI